LARLIQVPQGQVFQTDKATQRNILAQRGVVPEWVARMLEESGLGAVEWVESDDGGVVRRLQELKRRFESGEFKWSPGEPKPVFLVAPGMIERLERDRVWSEVDDRWELPLLLVGISAEALYPANLPSGEKLDLDAILAYFQALFSWGDLLPGRVVEELKGSFLDHRHQTLLLSVAA